MVLLKGVSKLSIGAISGILSAIFGAFCGWILFPALISIFVDKQTVLEEGTEQFERFRVLPQPLDFKVYVFNVTNPTEILNGAVPNVEEVGPYVYKQYRWREIEDISPDKTLVSYRGFQRFHFDEEASAPLTEHDNLVVLNAAVNSILQFAESTPAQLGLLNGQLKDVFGEKYASMFIATTPFDILFNGISFCNNPSGIAGMICSVIRTQKPQSIKENEDGSFRFSLLGHKNNSHDGLFQIYTGVGGIEKLGLIRKWKRRKTIKTWLNATDGGTSICNMINGTDTTIYTPHIKEGSFIYIFSTDLCRSAVEYYTAKVKVSGASAYRFQVSDDFLEKIGPEYGNECFCTNSIVNAPTRANGCLLKGTLDLTNCQGGPIVVTLPHFLGVAAEYNRVNGIHPNASRHLMYADMEPNSGYPLSGAKRLQMNMFLKKINQIDMTKNIKTTLFPIVWVEEVLELNDEMKDLIKWKLVVPMLLVDITYQGLLFGGIAIFVICSVWYMLRRKQENQVKPMT